VSKARPLASVGAVLVVLRACRQLETLWIVFDGSLGVPSVDDKGKRWGELGEVERKDENENENEWDVRNHRITHIRVGHSTLGDDKGLKGLAGCLRAVIPRLEKIRADRYPLEVWERWEKAQEILLHLLRRCWFGSEECMCVYLFLFLLFIAWFVGDNIRSEASYSSSVPSME